MHKAETHDSLLKSLPLHTRLYLIGAGILIAGLLAAAVIYKTAADPNDDNPYDGVDASVYAVSPMDSRRYQYELERIGGKSAVLAAELDDWFSSLWHGKKLGVTVAFLATGSALVCCLFAYLLSFQPPPDESEDK